MLDDSSSSITVTPDGSIRYGAFTRYDFARGHLMKFSVRGTFQRAYSLGWDSTPAVYRHDGRNFHSTRRFGLSRVMNNGPFWQGGQMLSVLQYEPHCGTAAVLVVLDHH